MRMYYKISCTVLVLEMNTFIKNTVERIEKIISEKSAGCYRGQW